MKITDKLSLETFLKKITDLVINFEQGDVMTLSEILSCLEEFSSELIKVKEGKLIYEHLVFLTKQEIKQSSETFAAIFSQGLDLLSDLLKEENILPQWKNERIQKWIDTSKNPLQSLTSQPVLSEEKSIQNEGNVQLLDKEQAALFISDCNGRIARAQDLILTLETEHNNLEIVKELFRIFHTIKGECGFLKLTILGLLSHSIENIFDLLRSQKLDVSENIINILLKGLDLVQNQIFELKSGTVSEQKKLEIVDYTNYINQSIQKTEKNDNNIQLSLQIKTSDNSQKSVFKSKNKEEIKEKSPKNKNVINSPEKSSKDDALIKVRASNINYLVDMIGELLICLGQMKENTTGLPQVRKIAKTLQYAGMQLRTENMHTLFSTVRRIIRDTSQKVGKNIKSSFKGEDLEIDRNLIESLEEPLMHLIRNAIDHGIETLEERVAAGKPKEGLVTILAERRGNNIVISVSDDGCGLDKNRILKKAISKGLITQAAADTMSDSAIYNLIFVSGFSTNESVSIVSGRGVGMDIVQEIVHKSKGYIRIISTPGKGTTFSLYFPLSTAIIDGLLVKTGENIFIIPVNSVIESFKIEINQIDLVASGLRVLNIREEVLPVISIANVFNIAVKKQEIIATIIENAEKEKFALLSEEILAKREVVIKNLSPCFKNYKGINSGTVLPGGSIGFVLDIEQIITLARKQITEKTYE